MDVKTWRRRVYRFNAYNREQFVAQWAAQIPAQSKVLDVGAGTGRYRSFFAHCNYYAQDIGQTPALIGRYTKLDYESDITDISVPDESFDIILCTEVLEHTPEPIRAVEEMTRILKSGGCMLLTAPLGSFLHQEPYHFYGGFTPHWYRKFLSEFDLEVKSIEANAGFFSWFGQEATRYSVLIRPRRTGHKNIFVRIGLTFLWVITWPFLCGLFPLIGGLMDQLALERIATVGYHVVAVKK